MQTLPNATPQLGKFNPIESYHFRTFELIMGFENQMNFKDGTHIMTQGEDHYGERVLRISVGVRSTVEPLWVVGQWAVKLRGRAAEQSCQQGRRHLEKLGNWEVGPGSILLAILSAISLNN